MSTAFNIPGSAQNQTLTSDLVSQQETRSRSRPGAVEFRSVRKCYGNVTAVSDISLSIQPGEFVSLLGPSGSGKSTLLMLLAGFEQTTSGEICVDGQSLANVPPNRREQGVVFQSYALFPHMTVRGNVEFPLAARGITGARAEAAVDQALRRMRMSGFEERYPGQLSGGQQQRVALARAIVFDPPVILMDESLSALDRKLRQEMRYEIKRLHRELGKTIVYVTHDQEEALTMSDRVVVMSAGGIAQIGTPAQIYDEPASAYVAGFVGEANFLPGSVLRSDGHRGVLRTAFGEVEGVAPQALVAGQEATAMVRPEAVSVADGDAALARASGTVVDAVFLGEALQYHILAAGRNFIAKVPRNQARAVHAPGSTISLSFATEDVRVFPAQSSSH